MGAAVEVDWGDVRMASCSQEGEQYVNGPWHAIFLPVAVCSLRQAPTLPLSKINSTQGALVLSQLEFSASMDL